MVNIKTLLDKATNPDHSEPDWESILDIVEEIKQKNVSVKNAVKELRKKLLDPNSTVVYYTLQVLDSIMKNCASDVHKEILSHEFMGIMKSVVTSSRDGRSDKAIDKALELIGEWKGAFGNQPGYKAVHDIFGELEREGFVIPETQVASASFVKQPPEWVVGERCHMCRQEFSRLRGYFRHHCRNCGKSVCTQCSSKRAPLPDYGITQPTRVCDLCYKTISSRTPASDGGATSKGGAESSSSDLPIEYLRSSLAHEPQVPSTTATAEAKLKEEDDLQLAIAMSLNEQENKKTTSAAKKEASPTPPATSTAPSAPPPSTPSLYSSIAQEAANTAASTSLYSVPAVPSQQQTDSASDPNLARYLDRSYWEQRRDQQASGGGAGGGAPPAEVAPAIMPASMADSSLGSPLAVTVQNTVEQFVQRLQQVSAAGGSVAADPIILSLYQSLNALHPQLLKQIDDVQQKKTQQEQLLHKINEAKTARAALNTMRREHLEKVRQQEEEQALLARMQMEQKLALLRQQKQEQLAYQQSLQQKRLENMHAQRQEYEKQLQAQRDMERQQLIAQEQQVLQRQLRGGSPIHMQTQVPSQPVQPQFQPMMAPPPSMDPSSVPLHTMSLHDPTVSQAPPLPTKLDHNISTDPTSLPPPYQPPSLQPDTAFQTMPTLHQQPPLYLEQAGPSSLPVSYGDTSLWPSPQLPPSQPATLTSLQLQPPSTTQLQQPSPVGVAPLGQQLPGSGTPYNALPYQPQPSATPVAQPQMTMQHQPQPQMSMQPQPQMSMQPSVAQPQMTMQPQPQMSMQPSVAQPQMTMQPLPQQQQMFQPPSSFGQQPTMDQVPPPQTMDQLPGQQPMGMQPPSMQATHPNPSSYQRQESGPPLITFD